ncbi:MAG: hypothetical protein QXY15_10665 [Candidatus Nitrosotenuis sp.]
MARSKLKLLFDERCGIYSLELCSGNLASLGFLSEWKTCQTDAILGAVDSKKRYQIRQLNGIMQFGCVIVGKFHSGNEWISVVMSPVLLFLPKYPQTKNIEDIPNKEYVCSFKTYKSECRDFRLIVPFGLFLDYHWCFVFQSVLDNSYTYLWVYVGKKGCLVWDSVRSNTQLSKGSSQTGVYVSHHIVSVKNELLVILSIVSSLDLFLLCDVYAAEKRAYGEPVRAMEACRRLSKAAPFAVYEYGEDELERMFRGLVPIVASEVIPKQPSERAMVVLNNALVL